MSQVTPCHSWITVIVKHNCQLDSLGSNVGEHISEHIGGGSQKHNLGLCSWSLAPSSPCGTLTVVPDYHKMCHLVLSLSMGPDDHQPNSLTPGTKLNLSVELWELDISCSNRKATENQRQEQFALSCGVRKHLRNMGLLC